ncbi:hypothetical protein ACFQJD_17245 [Haloplanus sp. GCM10025708]|uniref:hypothetical protein n=1 Tax=Haloferacaceae TaxID=1644056 RepID=UPI0036240F12
MPIEFDRHVQEASFHSPLEEFEAVTVETEVRRDPLTDRNARVVSDHFLMAEDPDIEAVVTDDEGCYFCPDSVDETTPTYPDWVGMDRGHVGEATSFPNLNPYGKHSNVVALTEDHYVPIDEFTAGIFEDGLVAALEYVRRAMDHDADAEFGSVNMNFLRSAGSSIIHPHVQTLVDGEGTNEQRLQAGAARAFYEQEDEAYWPALVDEERDGERYVGATGDVEWVAPFAPKHHRHLVGVVDDPGLPDDDALADLAAGIENALAHYGDVGLNSFNFALHLTEDDPATPPVFHLVARSVFDEYYWSDATFFTSLHDEGVVDVAPETYAAEARAFF